MFAFDLLIAWEYPSTAGAIVLALVLTAGLLVPFIVKEIRKGKVSMGPRQPLGASEPHPGHRGDPAPGHPDAQSDPYDVKNSR
jgi:hypothetical protein